MVAVGVVTLGMTTIEMTAAALAAEAGMTAAALEVAAEMEAAALVEVVAEVAHEQSASDRAGPSRMASTPLGPIRSRGTSPSRPEQVRHILGIWVRRTYLRSSQGTG